MVCDVPSFAYSGAQCWGQYSRHLCRDSYCFYSRKASSSVSTTGFPFGGVFVHAPSAFCAGWCVRLTFMLILNACLVDHPPLLFLEKGIKWGRSRDGQGLGQWRRR